MNVKQETRAKCACCGKPYGSRLTKDQRDWFSANDPVPAYTGNLRVIRQRVSHWGGTWKEVQDLSAPGRKRLVDTGNQQMVVERTLWDGESYWRPYEPFCTLRCALAFAKRAHKAGVRVR